MWNYNWSAILRNKLCSLSIIANETMKTVDEVVWFLNPYGNVMHDGPYFKR